MSDKSHREYYVGQCGEKTRDVSAFRMLPDIAGCTTRAGCCLTRRQPRGRRPNPAVILDQRQIGAKILDENRHASDDSAWQNMLPAPLWGLDSIWTMNPESPVHGLSERLLPTA